MKTRWIAGVVFATFGLNALVGPYYGSVGVSVAKAEASAVLGGGCLKDDPETYQICSDCGKNTEHKRVSDANGSSETDVAQDTCGTSSCVRQYGWAYGDSCGGL